ARFASGTCVPRPTSSWTSRSISLCCGAHSCAPRRRRGLSGRPTERKCAMPDHENVPYIVIEREGGGVGPFLWGVLLGAGVALLLAPRSGEETQEEIRLRARKL